MGLAGALFAHKIGFLAPDIFTVLLSIQFLLLVIVGGLGSLHGALFGAVFVALLPALISHAARFDPGQHGRPSPAHRHRPRSARVGDAVERLRQASPASRPASSA